MDQIVSYTQMQQIILIVVPILTFICFAIFLYWANGVGKELIASYEEQERLSKRIFLLEQANQAYYTEDAFEALQKSVKEGLEEPLELTEEIQNNQPEEKDMETLLKEARDFGRPAG